MNNPNWMQIGMNGRFFPANWRPARQEIAFAQGANFSAMQFAVRDGHWTEERLGDSFGVIHDLSTSTLF